MNRTVLTIVALIAILVAVGGAWWVVMHASASGSPGDTISDQRALQPFRQVTLDGNAEVTLVQGSSEAIAIEVTGGSVVHAEVRDGVLMIHADDERRWWSYIHGGTRRAPRITVTFHELDALRASGAIKLGAERLRTDALALRFSGAAAVRVGALEARTLTLNGSGAFKADVAGRVDEQRISISGAGDYRAGDLVSDRASISVSGAGRVLVNAQKALDVDLSGAAKVDYKGDPKVTQRVSGVGRIRRHESAERLMHVAASG